MDIKSDAVEIPSTDDVYSIIRSPEIRDHYRREDVLGIFDKEQLILHSYTSIQQKAVLLEQLLKTGDEQERRKISEMCRLFRDYIDRIYHPAVRTVFLMEASMPIWKDESNSIYMRNYGLEGVYDTVDELTADVAGMYRGHEEGYCVDVSVLEVPQGKKVRIPFGFSLCWIDGKWEIKELYIERFDGRGIRAQGFHKDTEDRFHNTGGHHLLPFENGCRLKLQLPFMKEPRYGTLMSEMDGLGCWYHFLCQDGRPGDGTGYIDLTWWEIDISTGYSSLDWIGRA